MQPVSGANDYDVIAQTMQGLKPGIFFVGQNGPANVPFLGGTLVPLPDLIVLLTTNFRGEINLPYTWPSGFPPGFPMYLQYFVEDPSGPRGFSASNAVRLITP